MKAFNVDYRVKDINCTGYLVEPHAQGVKLPGIVMYTDFWGLNARQKKVAEKLSHFGAVIFAADLYGHQKCATNFEHAKQLMDNVTADQETYHNRVCAPFELLKQNSGVDKIFALGYCFGGANALYLARTVDGLYGVISLHGLLGSQIRVPKEKKMPKILLLHGAKDPFVSPEDLSAFQNEMNACHADYTLVSYGQCTHAFTNTEAAQSEETAYHYKGDRRSDILIQEFLRENF